MRLDLHLKTQSDLRDEVEAYLNDSTNQLATAAQYYECINRALGLWSKRVVAPQLYEFDFAAGIFDYALPRYIRRPFYIEIRKTIFGLHGVQLDIDDTFSWQDFVAYDVKPNGTGGFDLHLHSYPYAESGRITWFAENGPVPTGSPVTNGSTTSTATSVVVTVSASPFINDSGYIKIGSEWMSYAGVTRTSATSYTLTNLIRGLYGTTAATHNTASAVLWGIAVDDDRLWQQLYDRAGSYVHMLNLHKSTVEDTNRHEKLLVLMRDAADNFWVREGYVSQRAPRFVPKRGSLGAMPWG